MKKIIVLSFISLALLTGCSNDTVVRNEIPTETQKTTENVKLPSPNETASPILNKDQTEVMANQENVKPVDEAEPTQSTQSVPSNKEEPSAPSSNAGVLPEIKKEIIDGYTDISFYPNLTSNNKLKDITAKELLSAIGNPDKNIVVFLSTYDSGHCQDAIVKVQEAAIENDQDVYLLAMGETTYDERDELTEKLKPILFKDDAGSAELFVPHIFAIKNGEISKEYSKLGFVPEVTDYNFIFE